MLLIQCIYINMDINCCVVPQWMLRVWWQNKHLLHLFISLSLFSFPPLLSSPPPHMLDISLCSNKIHHFNNVWLDFLVEHEFLDFGHSLQ